MRFFVSRIWPTATSSSKRRGFSLRFLWVKQTVESKPLFWAEFSSLFFWHFNIERCSFLVTSCDFRKQLGTSDFFLSGSDLFVWHFCFRLQQQKIGGSPLPLGPHLWRKWQLFGTCLPIVSSLVQRKKCDCFVVDSTKLLTFAFIGDISVLHQHGSSKSHKNHKLNHLWGTRLQNFYIKVLMKRPGNRKRDLGMLFCRNKKNWQKWCQKRLLWVNFWIYVRNCTEVVQNQSNTPKWLLVAIHSTSKIFPCAP